MADGLHLATLGGLCQALALGFLGLYDEDGALAIRPSLPRASTALSLRLRFGGQPVGVRVEHGRVTITSIAPPSFTSQVRRRRGASPPAPPSLWRHPSLAGDCHEHHPRSARLLRCRPAGARRPGGSIPYRRHGRPGGHRRCLRRPRNAQRSATSRAHGAGILEQTDKPVVVMAPEAISPGVIRRLLLPLEGTEMSSQPVLARLLPLLVADIELVVLHVFTDATLPVMLDRLGATWRSREGSSTPATAPLRTRSSCEQARSPHGWLRCPKSTAPT